MKITRENFESRPAWFRRAERRVLDICRLGSRITSRRTQAGVEGEGPSEGGRGAGPKDDEDDRADAEEGVAGNYAKLILLAS